MFVECLICKRKVSADHQGSWPLREPQWQWLHDGVNVFPWNIKIRKVHPWMNHHSKLDSKFTTRRISPMSHRYDVFKVELLSHNKPDKELVFLGPTQSAHDRRKILVIMPFLSTSSVVFSRWITMVFAWTQVNDIPVRCTQIGGSAFPFRITRQVLLIRFPPGRSHSGQVGNDFEIANRNCEPARLYRRNKAKNIRRGRLVTPDLLVIQQIP